MMATKAAANAAIVPLADRIMVKRVDTGEQRFGSIVIPESARDKTNQCDVVAVGPGRLRADGARVPMTVAVGDRIVIGPYGGTAIKIDGTEYFIMREDDVIAIVRT